MAATSAEFTEHFLPLPVTQLRLCVRIWNAETNAAAASAAAATPAPGASPPVPPVRAHDVHLVLLHGWLDNVASWDRFCRAAIAAHARSPLAAKLTASARAAAGNSDISPSRLVCYCVELSGHGLSDHRRPGHGFYFPTEHSLDILQALPLLGLQRGHPSTGDDDDDGASSKHLPQPLPFHIIGHSMGGATAAIVAAALGPACTSLILMDSIGPWSPAALLSVNHGDGDDDQNARKDERDPALLTLALAMQEHALAGNTRPRRPKLYPSLESIERKYVAANPFMDEQSALALARRAVRKIEQDEHADWLAGGGGVDRSSERWRSARSSSSCTGGFAFRHDSGMISSALLRPSEDTALASFDALRQTRLLVFLASNARRRALYAQGKRDPRAATHWLLPETNPAFESVLAKRLQRCSKENGGKGATLRRVEGDHHIHMDVATADMLACESVEFIHSTYAHATRSKL